MHSHAVQFARGEVLLEEARDLLEREAEFLRGKDAVEARKLQDGCMVATAATRIVIVAPDSLVVEPGDEQAAAEVERSRSLRIGLLEAGYNIVAVLPAGGGAKSATGS